VLTFPLSYDILRLEDYKVSAQNIYTPDPNQTTLPGPETNDLPHPGPTEPLEPPSPPARRLLHDRSVAIPRRKPRPRNRPSNRHRRKCTICRHPDREVIEQEFVNWHSVWHLAKQYKIDDHRSIYRHASATGLIERRRDNMRWCLDSVLECAPGKVTADSVIRAVRAHACLTEDNRWVEPPSRVEFTVAPKLTIEMPTEAAAIPPSGSSSSGVLTPEARILDVTPDPAG